MATAFILSSAHSVRALQLGALALWAVAGGCASKRGVEKAMEKAEIRLDFKIFSTPVFWGEALVGVGGHEQEDGEKATAVYAYSLGGRPVPGFPILRHGPYLVPPSSQAGVADLNGSGSPQLVVVDGEGRPLAFRADGSPSGVTPASAPAHAFLAWQPVGMRSQDGGPDNLLLISRDYQPRIDSHDGVDVVNAEGRSLAGYPQKLSGTPQLHPPLVDAQGGRVYVVLQSGAVDGFQLSRGTRLRGFPSAAPEGDLLPFGYRTALYGPWNALVMAVGDGQLRRISLDGGAVSRVVVPDARSLTTVVATGSRLYAVDEAAGTLLRITAEMRVTSRLPLKLPAGCNVYYLEAVGSAYVILVSSQTDDPDARVAPLFEQNSTPEIRRKIAELADAEKQRRFRASQISPAQRKEIEHSITMMKRSYLQNSLGFDKTAALLAGEALVHVQVVADNGTQMELLMDDSIKGYTPETGFGYAGTVYPALHADAAGMRLAVPLNGERIDDPKDEYRSLIRIYQLPR